MPTRSELALEVAGDTYRTLHENLLYLLNKATTDDEKNQLINEYVTARDVYWSAQHASLLAATSDITKVAADAKVLNAKIEEQIENQEKLAKILDTITAVVSLGARLVTLAA
jgi:hypothetical protein